MERKIIQILTLSTPITSKATEWKAVVHYCSFDELSRSIGQNDKDIGIKTILESNLIIVDTPNGTTTILKEDNSKIILTGYYADIICESIYYMEFPSAKISVNGIATELTSIGKYFKLGSINILHIQDTVDQYSVKRDELLDCIGKESIVSRLIEVKLEDIKDIILLDSKKAIVLKFKNNTILGLNVKLDVYNNISSKMTSLYK